MAGNLTRDEAAARAQLLTVRSYTVRLDLRDERHFESVTTVTFDCARPGATTFIDLAAEAVTQVTLNGRPVPAEAAKATPGRLTLEGLAPHNELTVVARCRYSMTGEGLHRCTDPEDGETYLYTHFEPADAHRVYACFDQPDLKALLELTVLVPPGWKVVSTSEPASEPILSDGGARWHFPPTPPLPPYVTVLAAGPYHAVRDDSAFPPIGVYCRKSLAAALDPEGIVTVARQGLEFYEEQFGRRYPFTKCDFVFVPEFGNGAMENAATITFCEDFIFRCRVTDAAAEERAEIILHELAHMWFGDLVTMRWWDDLWLKESFATFASVLCQAERTRWSGAWTTFTQFWKDSSARQDQLPTTHPIAADIPDLHAVEVNFDGITYAKGASVLKQLVAYVGRDHFLEGVREYFANCAWGNATLADLLAHLEKASGRDLAAWSAEWLETSGINTLRPSADVDESGRFTSFEIVQEPPSAGDDLLRSHRLAIGLYSLVDGRLVRVGRHEADIAGARTQIPALIGTRRPDLVLVNDDDLGYAKIRFDRDSLTCLTSHIGAFAEPLPAALCWAAVWDMCRDGELAARDYVRLVLAGVASTTEIGVVETMLERAGIAVRRYADPAWRHAGLAWLGSSLWSLAVAAPPGSDAQLAYLRAFARVATEPADLDLAAGLLHGGVSLTGLSVDTDLRWELLYRLVVTGRAGPAYIDAELRRDAGSSGQRNATRCRAALPDAAAKRTAWQAITEVPGSGMPAATFKALLAGFNDPDQEELTAPYRADFFRLAERLWAQESREQAVALVKIGFPSAVSARTVALAEEFLAAAPRPPGLRRLVVEACDDIRRALRAQQRAHLTNTTEMP
jgi:aminopeptidase N